MRKQRKIKNTNIRFNLMVPADQQAWTHLQNLDRKQHKSYSQAVVAALNDYFGRQERLSDDPYLETRSKEDAFLQKVLDAVEKGARNSMPLGLAGNLLQLFQPMMAQPVNPSLPSSVQGAVETQIGQQEQEEVENVALDFADGF